MNDSFTFRCDFYTQLIFKSHVINYSFIFTFDFWHIKSFSPICDFYIIPFISCLVSYMFHTMFHKWFFKHISFVFTSFYTINLHQHAIFSCSSFIFTFVFFHIYCFITIHNSCISMCHFDTGLIYFHIWFFPPQMNHLYPCNFYTWFLHFYFHCSDDSFFLHVYLSAFLQFQDLPVRYAVDRQI